MKTAITINYNHSHHVHEGHVERPDRLHHTKRVLEADGILETLIHVDSTEASVDDVLLVHPQEYYDKLVTASEAGHVWLDSDTYSTPDSLKVSLEALGGLINISRRVIEGPATNGFAVVRPPGHHALPESAMGFCLLANIAIAARWIQQTFDIKRILIVDFDVHHGNGTHDIFYDDPDILFISTHQYPFYPGTGPLQNTGVNAGKGATINIPLPAGTGDESLGYVFEHILRQRVAQFKPECILVSAGYDAHWMDPLGGLNISISGFAKIVKEILYWAQLYASDRTIALLEGGYHSDALAHCVLTTLRLLQDTDAQLSDPFGLNPDHANTHASLIDYLEEIKQFHLA